MVASSASVDSEVASRALPMTLLAPRARATEIAMAPDAEVTPIISTEKPGGEVLVSFSLCHPGRKCRIYKSGYLVRIYSFRNRRDSLLWHVYHIAERAACFERWEVHDTAILGRAYSICARVCGRMPEE